MAGRSVSVAITANTAGFTAGMSKVSGSAKTAAQSVKSSFSGDLLGSGSSTFAKFDKGLASIGKHKQSINTLSKGLLGFGVVAGVGVGAAIKSFAQFDQAMSNVAATGSDARDNLGQLRDAAVDAGAKTAFSATEAAQGIEALAKAGVSSKDALGGGLKGSLDLAAAGNLGVAGSAEAAASAMNQFGLSGKDIPHIADLLAQAAGTAQGEVSDMAAALNQSGLVANQFGLSIDETSQALALFAKNGLTGSDAGTSFKTMLTSLYAPTGTAAKALDALGVSAYDSTGAIKDINPLADELKSKLDALSEGDRNAALKNIFGSDAIRAGTILLKDGSAGLTQMATDFGKFGTAADVAKIKMNNLNGDIEQLKGSLETAFIGAGSGGNDFLRSLAQSATGAVNAFNDLSPAAQQNTLKIAAGVAATALAVGGLGKLVVAAAETRAALLALGITATGVRGRLAGLGGAGLLAIAGFVAVQAASAALDDQLNKNSAGIDGYKESLAGVGKSGAELDGQFATFGSSFALVNQGVGDSASAFAALKDTLNPVSQGFRAVGDALGMSSTAGILADEFDKLDQALVQMDPDQAAAGFSRLFDQGRAAGLTVEQINATFDDYKKKQLEAASATGTAASALRTSEIAFKNAGSGVGAFGGSVDAAIAALAAIDPSIKRTAEQSSQLAGSLFAQGDAFQNTVSASSAYQQSIDEANKALDANGNYLNKSKTALSDTSEKGRENIGVLNNLASSGKAYVQSLIQQGAGADKAKAATQQVRDEFIKAADAAGLTGKQAAKLADSYGLIPSKVSTKVEAFGLAIQATQVEAFKAELMKLPAEQRTKILSIFDKKGAAAAETALARIKDRQVIVKAKAVGANDIKGMDKSLKALKDRRVEAKARGDKKEVVALDRAMKALKDRRLAAKVKAEGVGKTQGDINGIKGTKVKAKVSPEGVGQTQSAINHIAGKTVRVHVGADGVGSVQSSINSIHGKTISIGVRKFTVAEGGLMTPLARSSAPTADRCGVLARQPPTRSPPCSATASTSSRQRLR
jgi:TP901 family phage tail tape measure protein